MYVGTPRTIILAGPLDVAQSRSLGEYCQRVYIAGRSELHLDMSGVTECSRAGLDGLAELVAGSTPLTVTVSGARWTQFATALSTAPVGDAPALRVMVGHLVGTPERRRPSPTFPADDVAPPCGQPATEHREGAPPALLAV